MIAFWKYDQFPFCLHSPVASEESDGRVRISGYGGMLVKPFAYLPDVQGEKVSADLDALKAEYEAKKSELLAEYKAKAKQVANFL